MLLECLTVDEEYTHVMHRELLIRKLLPKQEKGKVLSMMLRLLPRSDLSDVLSTIHSELLLSKGNNPNKKFMKNGMEIKFSSVQKFLKFLDSKNFFSESSLRVKIMIKLCAYF